MKIKLVLRFAATCVVWIAWGYILQKYEYISQFNNIDNIVGIIPVALALTSAVGATFILWMKHTKLIISIFTTILVVAPAILFPTALTGNWWVGTVTINEAQASPDLSVFIPFSEGSQTAKLDEESSLRLSEDFPVLDGATALYPVYASFAEAVYDENIFSEEYVLCTNTRNAYETIISGEKDIIFVAGASAQQLDAAKAANVNLVFTPVGREAFVFLVGNKNPVNNITYQQIKNIYSGKTASWRTIGWNDGGGIIAFQRPEGSGSQTGLQNVMANIPIQVPQPLPDSSLIGTNSLMKQVSVEWQGTQPALGYSYRYYATTMYSNPDVKLLSINGTEPSIENIKNGSYPFVSDFYAVTNGEPKGNSKLLIEWILSPQGQLIIEKTGYTPIF